MMRTQPMSPLALSRHLMIAVAALCLYYGCATTPSTVDTIARGQTVTVDYTCRLKDGSILSTTRKATAFAKDANLSHAFIPSEAYDAVRIPVGREILPPSKPIIHTVKEEITYRLAQQLEGLAYGDTHHLSVTSEAIPDLPKMERYLQYARTMQRPKQRSIPKTQFISNTGQEPVAGQTLYADQAMPWNVLEVSENSVTVEYVLKEGQKLMMPYGEAVVHDRGDHYELEIEARPGGLVRVGPYIGRIVDITDQLFLVDFEHPFGGRALSCDVTANRIQESIDGAMKSAAVIDKAKE